jgi:hypothetical protein
VQSLEEILAAVGNGTLDQEEAARLIDLGAYHDLGHTVVDVRRRQRVGAAEVIYCAGKSPEQVQEIFRTIAAGGENVLASRATDEMFRLVASEHPEATYHKTARAVTLIQEPPAQPETSIAVVTAGTSDLPVAEEAAVTAEFLGNPVLRVSDVGVAGIGRLFRRLEDIRRAKIVIVAAGMEGALPSVVGGLVEVPVIAVPTSVGYGASFGGLAALLGMLNSCASGVCVVNIDNGFGAGYLANMMNRL